jgi:hypothetical protein
MITLVALFVGVLLNLESVLGLLHQLLALGVASLCLRQSPSQIFELHLVEPHALVVDSLSHYFRRIFRPDLRPLDFRADQLLHLSFPPNEGVKSVLDIPDPPKALLVLPPGGQALGAVESRIDFPLTVTVVLFGLLDGHYNLTILDAQFLFLRELPHILLEGVRYCQQLLVESDLASSHDRTVLVQKGRQFGIGCSKTSMERGSVVERVRGQITADVVLTRQRSGSQLTVEQIQAQQNAQTGQHLR